MYIECHIVTSPARGAYPLNALLLLAAAAVVGTPQFTRHDIADVNANGRPDPVVVGGRANKVAWYENVKP